MLRTPLAHGTSAYSLASSHSFGGKVVCFVSCASRSAAAITIGPPDETDSEEDPENNRESGLYGHSAPSIHDEEAGQLRINLRGRQVPYRFISRLSLTTTRRARTRPCLQQNALAATCATSETTANFRLEQCAYEQLRGRTFRGDAGRGMRPSN